MFDTLFFLIGLSITLSRGAFQALAVIYPSYKTYKALESRSLRAAQSMLVYWTITAFVSALKEFSDQLLGTYANFIVWKTFILCLKAAPLIIGPDRLYTLIVKPFYDANQERVDAVVNEAKKIKSIAQSAVPAVKEGNVEAAKEKVAEVVQVVKEDSTDLVQQLQEKAIELTDTIQQKTSELGLEIDREGVNNVLERVISQFEVLRDILVQQIDSLWAQHGSTIRQQTNVVAAKGLQYAPVAKEKASTLYQQQVLPRVQPLVEKVNTTYQGSVKPFVSDKTEKANALWVKHGGPARRMYGQYVQPFWQNTASPFLTQKFYPFMTDSFLPAVLETLIALKDRLFDLLSTPSDETRASRTHHKRRRAEARRRKGGKFQADISEESDRSSSSSSSGQIFKRQKTTSPTEEQKQKDSPVSSEQKSTLSNRKTKQSQDTSIDSDRSLTKNPEWSEPSDVRNTELDTSLAVHSDLNPEAAPFEPSHPSLAAVPAPVMSPQQQQEPEIDFSKKESEQIPSQKQQSQPLLPTPEQYKRILQQDVKESRGNWNAEKGEQWGGEPRSQSREIAAE